MTTGGDTEGEMVFADRRDAGRRLATLLAPLRDEQPVVLALPRGGVPVAAEVARALGAPLDVIVVRKLGLPYQPELGFGAIGEGGVRLLDTALLRRVGLTERDVSWVEAEERRELIRRVRRYRGDRPPISVEGRTVVIVDDGLATGATARTAVSIARARGARRIVLAVPVAPSEAVNELRDDADQVVSLVTPAHFVAVGLWYRDFDQTSDDEVAALLRENVHRLSGPAFPYGLTATWSCPSTVSSSRGSCRYRPALGGSCSSLTEAGAAATAPGMLRWPAPSMSGASGRCCSIC